MVLSGKPWWLVEQRRFSLPLVLGVISDTHVTNGGWRRLSPEIPALFARFRVDLILHAGDVCVPAVLEALSSVAPVIAVAGNNDTPELRAHCRERETIEAGPYRLALLHGHRGQSARDEAQRVADRAHLVVYGHSHIPKIEQFEGTILFNPGSATDRRWQEHFGVGLIFLSEDGIRPELVLFRDPRHLQTVQPQ